VIVDVEYKDNQVRISTTNESKKDSKSC